MKVLIVFAHPERHSLNGALLDTAVKHFEDKGDEVKVSDLYAMNWKSELSREDFPQYPKDKKLNLMAAGAEAFYSETITSDVIAEQEKMKWADLVVLQFPMWWFSMPAIMKGWVDRVFAFGFGFGLGEYNDKHFGDRYGEGIMEGKKAMLMVTTGGWESHYSNRGINGTMDEILHHIQHGILFYVGFDILPPFVLYGTMSLKEGKELDATAKRLCDQLDNVQSVKPINYRKQNFGDYDIPSLVLKEGREQPGETGFQMHINKDNEETSL
ncbi:hypothetical protein NCAS_0A06950 [Naumovozyma castellii]|uniref:Flavodoxin-like fold domain-containing protein n=1 Tax=Naumovozyma castellii TaxID=27288 RepID=G0V705_NAUCA|nr:hypothetical protein NCAS_0A06950 [Naumovozyma castellii CBS 4309]CCC67253.1 hypothetical protein NCAS_0A06950 [Naumovozyma castellii CBS 4309]